MESLRGAKLSLSEIAFFSLKRRRMRTALLIISVTISISILTGVNAGVEGLQKTYMDMVTTNLGYTDLIIRSNTTSPTFNASLIASILNDESISAYSLRIQYGTPFTSSNGNFTVNNWAFIVGANPETDEEFGEYIMLEGSFSSIAEALQNQSNSCVVSEYYAKRMNIKVGDILYVGGYNISKPLPSLPEKVIALKVSGIVRDYGRVYWVDPKNPDNFFKINGELFLNLTTSQDLLDVPSNNVTQVYVHLKDMEKADVVTFRLQEKLAPDYSVANLKAKMLSTVQQSFASYRSIAVTMGGMSLMVAIMLLLNSIFAEVSERKYEIGVLRSIGASRIQVFSGFIIEAFVIAIAGALASIPFSLVSTKMVASFMPMPYIQNVGQAATAVEFIFSFNTIIFSLLIGIAATVAIGLIPSIAAARIDIVQALHPHMRVSRTGKKWRILTPTVGLVLVFSGLFLIQTGFARAARWIPDATAVVGFATVIIGTILLVSLALPVLAKAFSHALAPFLKGASIIVHRNILRNFRRSVFVYGAFAVSTALIVLSSSIVTVVASYDLATVKYTYGAGIQVWVSAPPSFSENIRVVNGVKNVAGAAYLYRSNMSFNGKYLKNGNIKLIGIDSAEFFQTVYKTHLAATLNGMAPNQIYSALAEETGNIILQDSLAQNLSASVGDMVTWLVKNQTHTIEKKFKVIATIDFLAGSWETVYKSASSLGYYVAIANFHDVAQYRDPTIGGSNFDQFYVCLDSNANVTQVVDSLDQNMAVIIGETILLSLLGITIGVSGGIGLSYFVLQVIPWWANIPQPSLTLSPYTMLISAVTAVIAAFASSAFPVYHVAKLNVVEALRR